MNGRSFELSQPILNQSPSGLERNKGGMNHPGGNDKADVIVVLEKIQNTPGHKPSTFCADAVRYHSARAKSACRLQLEESNLRQKLSNSMSKSVIL
jgi:hypothetical protein